MTTPAYISILSFLFITTSRAQEGLGCVHTTCQTPGQVRINVILDAHGNYAGGCNCAFPQTPQTPQTPPPPPRTPTVSEILCDTDRGTCECPVGHVGECRIRCEGSDACKDAIIQCNNDGYACFVDCISENACGGSSSIMGPVNGALHVNCVGEKACEGQTQMDGEAGSDLSVICDGGTSCKDAQLNFGNGVGFVACNGADSCMGIAFNLLRGVEGIPGAAFSCIGAECPSYAPKPFSNNNVGPITPGLPHIATTTPAPINRATLARTCTTSGACSCQNTEPGPCHIICDGNADACKDSVISCNSDGFDCVIDCLSVEACSGRSTISGPSGGSLTVNCMGSNSCSDSTIFEGFGGTDLTINCVGSAACQGSGVVFIFGKSGINTVSCIGTPDSCKDATFILPPHASNTVGMAFSCVGVNCPAEHASFNNGASPVPAPVPVVNNNPPTEPARIETGNGSPYCCITSIPNFKALRGRCWDETTAIGCAAEPNNRCKWDINNCLPNPPVNTILSTGCSFTYQRCTQDNQCCSETCHAGNICS